MTVTRAAVFCLDRIRTLERHTAEGFAQQRHLCILADNGGLLGAETPGLPEPVAQKVRAFFKANIDWVAEVLPADRDPAARTARAAGLVAAYQGAMMLATSMQDPALFDIVSAQALKAVLPETGSQ